MGQVAAATLLDIMEAHLLILWSTIERLWAPNKIAHRVLTPLKRNSKVQEMNMGVRLTSLFWEEEAILQNAKHSTRIWWSTTREWSRLAEISSATMQIKKQQLLTERILREVHSIRKRRLEVSTSIVEAKKSEDFNSSRPSSINSIGFKEEKWSANPMAPTNLWQTTVLTTVAVEAPMASMTVITPAMKIVTTSTRAQWWEQVGLNLDWIKSTNKISSRTTISSISSFAE